MIKLLALDMDGTLLNEAKEIPQAHIAAIHQAIEKGVKLVLCTGRPLFGVLPYYKKLGLDLQNEYVIVNNGCSTHQTSDWGLVDWQELSPADIEYLYDLAEKSDVQLTLFDESHYFVLGGKPNQVIENDAKLVFSDLTEISLEEATSGKFRMFQGMFLGTKCSSLQGLGLLWEMPAIMSNLLRMPLPQATKKTALRVLLRNIFYKKEKQIDRSYCYLLFC